MPSTAAAYGEPSTLNRGPETLPLAQGALRGRANDIEVSFEDETQARPVDDYLLQKLRNEPATLTRPADMGVNYDALPSLEVRRPYDTYEKEFSEHDPVTQMHGAHESASVRRADGRSAVPSERTAPRRDSLVFV